AMARKMAIALGSPFNPSQSREERRSFLIGCAERISLRLREIAQQRTSQAARPGSYGALITLDKSDLIETEMARLDIRLCAGSDLTAAGHYGAHTAGSAHGAKASFGRPVAGNVAGLIGRK